VELRERETDGRWREREQRASRDFDGKTLLAYVNQRKGYRSDLSLVKRVDKVMLKSPRSMQAR
jgi:anionic cell wall polymer biosynthesis LytR-Cps2A-Psr (LCP) family protein